METGEPARASILWGHSFFHLLLVYAEYISPLLGFTGGEQQVVWLVTVGHRTIFLTANITQNVLPFQ